MNKQEVGSQHGHAAGRDVNVSPGATTSVSAINGGTNIIGNQGPLSVHITTKPARPRVVVQPDEAVHVSPSQVLALRALRDDWIALHLKLKKLPLTHGAAQAAINRAAGATTQVLIRKDRYDDAVAYVKRQMAILAAMKSAPKKDAAWRSKRIGAIKARCKNQFDGVDIYKPYIKKSFNADSLLELDDEQLEKTYGFVIRKKP
ncbi:MAG: hypothetical protein KBC94_23465 [Pseudacidovorax sp.]|uniref:hypothetical protein n=1 Tax=Pseudacidovorax sp. TaxID=1934311 RepID=UPI001B50F17D|nr:hypothetical protein [Pseudacidovorax sp.]MBP6897387.1 hypothetical protein [Pseudacidovorax sp.]